MVVNYAGYDYKDTTIYDSRDATHEIVSAWDSGNSMAVATYTFDPKNVNIWNEVYSWLMIEIKVSNVSVLDGTGYVILSSSLTPGSEEFKYPISLVDVDTVYDKFQLMMDQFTNSSFDQTKLCRLTVQIGATSEIVVKWRKARIIHLYGGIPTTGWTDCPYITVTIDHTKIPTGMGPFPIRIPIDETRAYFPMVMKNHQTSIFAIDDSDDPVMLSVERWDSYTCVLWLLAKNVSSTEDTIIKIYYDPTGELENTDTLKPTIWMREYILILSSDWTGDGYVNDERTLNIKVPITSTGVYRRGGLSTLICDGSSSYMTIPQELANQTIFSTEGSITLEVRPTVSTQTSHACLVSKATAATPGRQAYSVLWVEDKIKVTLSNHEDGPSTITVDAPTDLSKVVLTVQWKDGVCDVWVNGTKEGTGSVPTLDMIQDIPVQLFGMSFNGVYSTNEYFEGEVYGLVMCSTILSDGDISVDHYNRLGTLVTISNPPDVSTLYENSTTVTLLASPTMELDHCQLPVVLHSGTGITRGDDIYFLGESLANCDDVLFVDANGVPLYFVEMVGVGGTKTIVVRFTDIPETGTVTYTVLYNWEGSLDYQDAVMTYENYASTVLVVDVEEPPVIVYWGDLLSKFMFKKQITVNASPDGAFSIYQLDVDINRDEGSDSGGDVFVSTHCRSDYRDVAFVDNSGDLVPHYVDVTGQEVGGITVGFTSLPGSGTKTFWMYYKTNMIRSLSDYKGTFGSGRVTTTNPPTIGAWGAEVLLEDLDAYEYYKIFTISTIPSNGWYGVLAKVYNSTGTDSYERVYLDDHYDQVSGDIICTTLDDAKVVDYTIHALASGVVIIYFLMKLTTSSPVQYKMRYGKALTDNQTDIRPVIICTIT